MRCKSKLFAEAFAQAVKGINPRSPKEFYQYVHAVSDGSTLTLTGTTGELTVKRSLPCEGVLPPSLLPVRVGEIAKLSADWIDIEADGSRLVVSTPVGRNTLSTRQVDDYPLPATISGAEVLIPADVWEAAGKFVGPCVDPTSTRYAMSGFHVTRSEGVLEIAATDGKRMAVLAGPACGEFPAATIRPEVLGMIEGDITATIDNKLAAFQSGNVSVWCQLIEGRFPDYAKAEEGATDGADNQVDVPAEPLLAAFKLVTVTTSEETTGVDVTFGDGKIVIESAAADKGESRSEIPSTADVKATMRLDCKMMADFLKRIPSGESVAVSYGEAAAVVLGYKRVRMVVMGMDR